MSIQEKFIQLRKERHNHNILECNEKLKLLIGTVEDPFIDKKTYNAAIEMIHCVLSKRNELLSKEELA